MLRPAKINVLFLIRKKMKKGVEFFFGGGVKTEKMTIDYAYNERTETV